MDLLLGLCSDMELCRRIRNQCVQTAKHLCVLVSVSMCVHVCGKVEGQVLKQALKTEKKTKNGECGNKSSVSIQD